MATAIMGTSLVGGMIGTGVLLIWVPGEFLFYPLLSLWLVCVLLYGGGAWVRSLVGEAQRSEARQNLCAEIGGEEYSEEVVYQDDQGEREAYSYTVEFQEDGRLWVLQEIYYTLGLQLSSRREREEDERISFEALRLRSGGQHTPNERIRIQIMGEKETQKPGDFFERKTENCRDNFGVFRENLNTDRENDLERLHELEDEIRRSDEMIRLLRSLLMGTEERNLLGQGSRPVILIDPESIEYVHPFDLSFYQSSTLFYHLEQLVSLHQLINGLQK